MKKIVDYSIVFPVMNQSDHIERVIRAYHKLLTKRKISFELVAVVNGTTDNSFTICQNVSKTFDNVKAFELKEGGYGLGILHGFAHSEGKYLCYLNCARINAEDLVLALREFEKDKNDIVHGVRASRDSVPWRKLGSNIYNTYCQLLFSLKTNDINGNPNVFSRANFEKLKLTYTDSMIDLQLLDRARQLKIKVREIEIGNYTRAGGISTSNFKTIFRLIKEVTIYFFKTRVKKS